MCDTLQFIRFEEITGYEKLNFTTNEGRLRFNICKMLHRTKLFLDEFMIRYPVGCVDLNKIYTWHIAL